MYNAARMYLRTLFSQGLRPAEEGSVELERWGLAAGDTRRGAVRIRSLTRKRIGSFCIPGT
jgi:hypothetical protein